MDVKELMALSEKAVRLRKQFTIHRTKDWHSAMFEAELIERTAAVNFIRSPEFAEMVRNAKRYEHRRFVEVTESL